MASLSHDERIRSRTNSLLAAIAAGNRARLRSISLNAGATPFTAILAPRGRGELPKYSEQVYVHRQTLALDAFFVRMQRGVRKDANSRGPTRSLQAERYSKAKEKEVRPAIYGLAGAFRPPTIREHAPSCSGRGDRSTGRKYPRFGDLGKLIQDFLCSTCLFDRLADEHPPRIHSCVASQAVSSPIIQTKY